MSERAVRERYAGHPLTQRLNALESSQRGLLLRSNPGVLRTVSSNLVVATPDALTQLATVTVTSGRWNCLGEGTIIKTMTGTEHFVMSIAVFGPDTGDAAALSLDNLPEQEWALRLTGSIYAPFSIFGDFTTEADEVLVALMMIDTGTTAAYSVSDVHLTLIPA